MKQEPKQIFKYLAMFNVLIYTTDDAAYILNLVLNSIQIQEKNSNLNRDLNLGPPDL